MGIKEGIKRMKADTLREIEKQRNDGTLSRRQSRIMISKTHQKEREELRKLKCAKNS